METKTAEQQAIMYVYELDSFAKELGFTPNEGWMLKAAASDDKKHLEKHFYTTLSVKSIPDNLLQLFRLVKARLAITNPNSMEDVDSVKPGMEYLVAYNPNRPVR